MKVYQDEAVGVVYDHAVFLSKLSSMKQVGMCGKEVCGESCMHGIQQCLLLHPTTTHAVQLFSLILFFLLCRVDFARWLVKNVGKRGGGRQKTGA